ncbi:MAG: hypothetical protein GY833_24010 [Aestuariibacter sp.]|nr:hypothetical protein [Aestuariibacter sp.]
MQPEFATFLRAQYATPPAQSIAEWAAENIDFALAPNYDTPIHAPFDPNFACYMIPVLEWLKDYTTREIWIRKCSRAAATEYILAWMRWIIANQPAPTYYLTADQLTTERFMKSRIKRGMKTCKAVHAKYKEAQTTEHDIQFPDMDFRVSWPSARGAFKQDGWQNIIADEFPTWKSGAPEMVRKRAGTYAFHKIVGLGSPDPIGKHPTGDPVILEYDTTDKCKWMMPDPITGNPFCWEFGGVKKAHGIKWPDDARDAETKEWDLERVRKESYYITPDGTRIENSEREAITRQGYDLWKSGDDRFGWVSDRPDAPKHIHGIWIVGPMVPFADGDFGVLSYRFLEAKRKGRVELRAYFYENWADVGDMPNSSAAADRSLKERELPYALGEPFWTAKSKDTGEPIVKLADNCIKGMFLTADVQKYHLWWVARWWVVTGEKVETGLEAWGNVAGFSELTSLAQTLKPNAIGVDIHYEGRYGETADFCVETGALAMMGDGNLNCDLRLRDDLNPNEGRKARGRTDDKFDMLTWHTDIFRTKLLAAIRGEAPFQWYVPKMAGRDYTRQVLSTHKVDGEWKRKKGHPDDHMFDCECMQLVLARYDSLIK